MAEVSGNAILQIAALLRGLAQRSTVALLSNLGFHIVVMIPALVNAYNRLYSRLFAFQNHTEKSDIVGMNQDRGKLGNVNQIF